MASRPNRTASFLLEIHLTLSVVLFTARKLAIKEATSNVWHSKFANYVVLRWSRALLLPVIVQFCSPYSAACTPSQLLHRECHFTLNDLDFLMQSKKSQMNRKKWSDLLTTSRNLSSERSFISDTFPEAL